ncbi:hypothetical protein CRM22_006917 [Opisthorchis felineus]|uniref:Uncharacterized protein n=1 Tax=Opisthorchis felineus TaxID=147828 RepID=A0A4S2LIR0_OPIFE|nr:hypothetical protein CRM22_006917 [Opisthorchis felineus]TGZ63475.1 hypothetical protein CRM22_006917 [Opisthorchis felineus]
MNNNKSKQTKRTAKKSPSASLTEIEKHKDISQPTVPPKIAARLTASSKDKQITQETLNKGLDQARERRMSLQADRADRLRQHLARVEQVAQMKKGQKPLTEEPEVE